jgi:regulatory protein
VATVTALRAVRGGVAVELDGAVWRTFPAAVVADAGLATGADLDRPRAAALARASRRQRSRDVALRALSRREHSRATLEARLARAGVGASDRRDAVEDVARAGLVDDARYAESRARHLAERGAGDLLVLDDLVRHGVVENVARQAVALLEPEAARAARIVERRGTSARTVRYLAARGFGEETLENLVAIVESRALG